MFGRNVSTASQEVRRNTWIGNGVLDSFLEDESLFGEFLRAPVSECLCSMVLRPVERLVFSPKER